MRNYIHLMKVAVVRSILGLMAKPAMESLSAPLGIFLLFQYCCCSQALIAFFSLRTYINPTLQKSQSTEENISSESFPHVLCQVYSVLRNKVFFSISGQRTNGNVFVSFLDFCGQHCFSHFSIHFGLIKVPDKNLQGNEFLISSSCVLIPISFIKATVQP